MSGTLANEVRDALRLGALADKEVRRSRKLFSVHAEQVSGLHASTQESARAAGAALGMATKQVRVWSKKSNDHFVL